MGSGVGVAIPFWLDRPDEEAVEIAIAADRAGLDTVWVGEMHSFDAFALATAIGLQTDRIPLKVGPLPISVRGPVSIALGVASVATLTGRRTDVALGASSPVIVSGWHDRPWNSAAGRMWESAVVLRALLDGERADFDGEHVHAHGFRLRRPQPQATLTIAAFGPSMTRVAARFADEVVLNLVDVEHVAAVRATLAEESTAAGREPPRLAVWVPTALDPGPEALAQLSQQLAVYLGAPGYGELFAKLGFTSLVERARGGERRSALAEEVPRELVAQIGAIGSPEAVEKRIAEYHRAGADHVALVPSTAGEDGPDQVLRTLARVLA
ncbi:MAG TPA: LLM class F420-dependent oxidoreductase [Solirubrobacteraceae bacterium]|nr:LLM class F420-dependent oxidoreductase [Solirubrobacteraceae bacterium]